LYVRADRTLHAAGFDDLQVTPAEFDAARVGNVYTGCYMLSRAKRRLAIERIVSVFPALRDKWRIEAGNRSGREQQVLELAMVLIVQPSLRAFPRSGAEDAG